MRIIRIVFIYLACSTAFAQTLIIGTLPFNPPFEVVTQNNRFVGLDIEIMQQVCRLINARCEFKPMDFAKIFEQIDSGQINLGIGSIIINSTRSQNYLLSSPYFPSSAQFFLTRGSTLKSPTELTQKKIGTVTDPIFINYLKKTYSSNELQIYDTLAPALLDLSSKKIDAFFLDKLSVNYWILNSDNQFHALGDAINIGQGYTIVARKDQTALMQQINQALMQMNKDGLDYKIFNNYL